MFGVSACFSDLNTKVVGDCLDILHNLNGLLERICVKFLKYVGGIGFYKISIIDMSVSEDFILAGNTEVVKNIHNISFHRHQTHV